MKELSDLYKGVMSDSELKKEYVSIKNDEELSKFLKKHDCDASLEDAIDFIGANKEAPDDELNAVAGGGCYDENGQEIVEADYKCALWVKNKAGYFALHNCKTCLYSKQTSAGLVCCNTERKKK